MIKMPIACLLILLYVGYYYSKKQQLPIYSTRMFKGVYISAIFHLIMDIITEYTVNHRDIVPDSLNYILHVLFLFSIMGMFWYIYLYLLSYVEQVKKVSRTERVIKLAVLLVVMLAILVLPIEYIDTPHGAYSLGAKAYALYAGTVYTLILIICCTLKNWKILSRNKRETMVLSVIIFAIFSVIQIVIPYSLLTGLAITLITIGIIMSNENPDLYIDRKTGAFNREGMEMVVAEGFGRGKKFRALAAVITGPYEREYLNMEISRYLVEKMTHEAGIAGYVFADRILVFLEFEKKYSLSENGMEQIMEKLLLHAGIQDSVKMQLMHCPLECGDKTELSLWISNFAQQTVDNQVYCDNLSGAFNRNAYERDCLGIRNNREPVWYFIADINNLKMTNDLFGHVVGDELIKNVAKILMDATRHQGRVYRCGGDEFVLLCKKDIVLREVLQDIERHREAVNQNSTMQVEFAIGYAKYDPATTDWQEVVKQADELMYRKKEEMKKLRQNHA